MENQPNEVSFIFPTWESSPFHGTFLAAFRKPGMIAFERKVAGLKHDTIKRLNEFITKYNGKINYHSQMSFYFVSETCVFDCVITSQRNQTVSIMFNGLAKLEVVAELYKFLSDEYITCHPDEYFIDFEERFYLKKDEMKSIWYAKTTLDFEGLYPFMYPEFDINKLLNTYINSSENILLLTGEPGTGKTSIIRMFVHNIAVANKGANGCYIKDRKVLMDDGFWASLIAADYDFLLLDDLDKELAPRDSLITDTDKERSIVNRLLSFSNGVFKLNTKILITTNVETNKVDSAILRPGRCFDALEIKLLNANQAMNIWTKHLKLDIDDYNEIFGEKGTISQAELISERDKLVKSKGDRSYIINSSASTRTKVVEQRSSMQFSANKGK